MTEPPSYQLPTTPQAHATPNLPPPPPIRRSHSDDLRVAHAVKQYFELVWRSLRRFGVPQALADDAAQQVFLIFARRLSSVEPARERSFLLGVSLRVAANVRRRQGRSREVSAPQDVDEAVEPGHNPEQTLAQKQRRAELDRALESLSSEQRAVFVLYELEGLSLPAIAAALGIPLGTATSRLLRGRERFEAWVRNHQPARELP